ncbi:hypothetical protein CHS0354_015941, partial [Potamilus streckersoni]
GAITMINSGKTPDTDGIPFQHLKAAGHMAPVALQLEFKDAMIVTLYRNKGIKDELW